jgi:trigger factor
MEGIATMGDAVNIDFVGYIDGETFDGGDSKGAGYELTLGSGSFIDDFEDQICGHSPGDAFDVEVTFPDDYGNEDLAGKDAVFETTLNYIIEKVEPEYNDALVASATDYATTDEFETAKREAYEAQAAESDLANDKDTVFNKVIEDSTVSEYPESEVNDRIQMVMDSVQQEAEANGVDIDTYLSNYGYDLDSFKDNIKTSVETYIREKMIVVAIADAEGITVTDEEVDQKVQELLKQTGLTDKETLSQQYGFKDEDYYYEVLYSKIYDFIYENAVAVEASNTDADEDTSDSDGLVDDYGTTEEE